MPYERKIGRPRKNSLFDQIQEEDKDPDLQIAETYIQNEETYIENKKIKPEIIKDQELKQVKCICTTACWIGSIPKLFNPGDIYEFYENKIPKYFNKLD